MLIHRAEAHGDQRAQRAAYALNIKLFSLQTRTAPTVLAAAIRAGLSSPRLTQVLGRPREGLAVRSLPDIFHDHSEKDIFYVLPKKAFIIEHGFYIPDGRQDRGAQPVVLPLHSPGNMQCLYLHRALLH